MRCIFDGYFRLFGPCLCLRLGSTILIYLRRCNNDHIQHSIWFFYYFSRTCRSIIMTSHSFHSDDFVLNTNRSRDTKHRWIGFYVWDNIWNQCPWAVWTFVFCFASVLGAGYFFVINRDYSFNAFEICDWRFSTANELGCRNYSQFFWITYLVRTSFDCHSECLSKLINRAAISWKVKKWINFLL